MTTAVEQLAKYNVTLQQAHDWVLGNLTNPHLIFETAKAFGITNAMLGEIAGGYSATEVQGFFAANGISSAVLDTTTGGTGTGGTGTTESLLPDDMLALASLVKLNTATGALSTESLRAQVIAVTGQTKYTAAFDPSGFDGAADGTFSTTDLAAAGLTHLTTLPATWETLESLFYGTMINTFKAIDMQEIGQVEQFVTANAAALQSGNQAILDQYISLMVSVFQDPANPPIFDDATISMVAVQSAQSYVELVAQGDGLALFDGLMVGFM